MTGCSWLKQAPDKAEDPRTSEQINREIRDADIRGFKSAPEEPVVVDPVWNHASRCIC